MRYILEHRFRLVGAHVAFIERRTKRLFQLSTQADATGFSLPLPLSLGDTLIASDNYRAQKLTVRRATPLNIPFRRWLHFRGDSVFLSADRVRGRYR